MDQIDKALELESEQTISSVTEFDFPEQFCVIMHNDNFTPMDFVVDLLQDIFLKKHDAAYKIMLDVHNNGSAICGFFPYEIAEMKVMQVREIAKDENYPLRCTIRKEH